MKRGAGRRNSATETLAATGLAAVVGGVAWYAALMRPILAAAAYGPICGHTSLFAPHCPPCYAALGLVGLGFGLIAAAGGRRAAAIRAAG